MKAEQLQTPDWHSTILKITDIVQQEQEVLRVQSSVLGTFGNFSATIGKPKCKKTFNVSAIAAAALSNGTILKYTATFPWNKRKVLYIDTEQSPYHCINVMHRIFKMANLPLDRDNDNFIFLNLRKFSPEQRIELIGRAIKETEDLGLVIIDGVRDLLYDINNPSEATDLMTLLMQWTDTYKIHIHTVLHQNKTDDNARGHVGTELNNKAETVIQVEKSPDGDSVVSVAVSRGIEFEPFAFVVDDRGLPVLSQNYSSNPKRPGRPTKEEDFYSKFTEAQHREALSSLFRGTQLRYGELEKEISKAYQEASGQKIGHNKSVALITFLKNKRMIEIDPETRLYRFVEDFYY